MGVSIVPAMSLETLLVDRADGIVTVTMNRPEKKNAANAAMWNELLATFREIGANDQDRVVVLTGAGGAFCSGADVSGMGGRETHGLANMRHISDVAMSIYRLPQPTIAKVRGVAAGAGMNIALLCDLIVASDNARFSEIFARRGLTIDFGGSWALPRRVGMHRAKELTLLTDIIDAAEADRIGLVNRVDPRRRARRVRRRLGRAPCRRAADRPRPVQAPAEQRHRGDARAGARRGGRGADRQLLDEGHRRGRVGVPGEARPDVPGSLNAPRR